MVVNTDVKLEQPDIAYGAVYGRKQKQQNKRYMLFAVILLLWLTAVATWIYGANDPKMQEENFTNTSIFGLAVGFTIITAIIGFFGGIWAIFGYNEDVYAYDVYRNRNKYAATVFREWFQKRYDVRISADQALDLMNGNTVHIDRLNSEGRRENMQVFFQYDGKFRILADLGRRPSSEYVTKKEWPLPDLNSIDFQLMVREDPARVRIYPWV